MDDYGPFRGIVDFPNESGERNFLEGQKNLGRAVDLAGRTGERRTVVEILGDDIRAIWASATLFGPFPVPPAQGFGPFDVPAATAVVEWGSAGCSAVAEVDWLHGTVINVNGSFLRIIARNDSGTTEQQGGEPPSLRLGAWAGYLQRSNPRAPQRTILVTNLVAGVPAAQTITIPNFATTLQVLRGPVQRQLDFEFLNNNTLVVPSAHFLPSSQDMAPIPIPQFADSVRLTNNGTQTINSVACVFGLNL